MDAETWTAIGTIGTWALAGGTLLLYCATRNLALGAQEAMRKEAADSRTDLQVRLHQAMEEKFDADAIVTCRARLAHQLLSGADHDQIQEPVLDFFESLAILDRRRLVDEDLTWNSFSFYATRWWTACRNYVFEERRKQGEEHVPISFTEFEAFAERLKDREARERKTTRAAIEPGADEIKAFLRDELALRPDVATSQQGGEK